MYFAVMFGSFREEVLRFQGRCLEELLTKQLDDVVRGRSSSLREEVFVQYLYGSFREEVLKFQGRCFEELLKKKIDDVVRGGRQV